MDDKTFSLILGDTLRAENRAPEIELPQFAVDGIVPKAVAFATSSEDVCALMTLVDTEGLTVIPRGGGTTMPMGNPPTSADIVLSTNRMNRLLAHDVDDLTATVEAGITIDAFNTALAEQGQGSLVDAPRAESATVGGVLASNVSGPRRLGFGSPRDRLIGVRVVDAAGVLIRAGGKVVKNVAGYDLGKLFIGSLGTLGIIVEATFKLSPLPKQRATVVGGFKTLEDALKAASELRSGWTRPLAMDILNAAAYAPVASQAGAPAMPDRNYFLAIDLGGGPSALERQIADLTRVIRTGNGKPDLLRESRQHDGFWRAIVNLGRTEHSSASMVNRCSVLFSQLPHLVHGHEALAEGSNLKVGIDAHLAAGVIRSFWWSELEGPIDPPMLASTVQTLRTAASHASGTFVIEACPSSLKGLIDVWGPVGPDFAIMRRLKEQFDPRRTLSPGRFIGGI